jgi:hypothetical protein
VSLVSIWYQLGIFTENLATIREYLKKHECSGAEQSSKKIDSKGRENRQEEAKKRMSIGGMNKTEGREKIPTLEKGRPSEHASKLSGERFGKGVEKVPQPIEETEVKINHWCF